MNRAEASRINGAQSNGPATQEGKAIASQNATKHGLNSQQIVLAHESEAEWETYLADNQKIYRPEGPCEEDLVHEIAAARWRLRRVASMERALIESRIAEAVKTLEAAGEDPSGARDLAYSILFEDGKALRNLHRYASRLRREYEKAIRELEVVQDHRADREEVLAATEINPQSTQAQNEPKRASHPAACQDEAALERALDQFFNMPLPQLPSPSRTIR